MRCRVVITTIFLSTSFAISGSAVFAQDYTSDTYKILTPTITAGGYSTSSSYGLQQVVTQFSRSTTTATSFGINTDFLSYPQVSTPTISASAGNAQVALSWSASQAYLGWTVTSYAIGRATSSGGPYSYSNVGNVTSATQTGLSNGTTYYFVIRVIDVLGTTIATSTQTSATPAAPAPPSSSGGGGGGGGGSSSGGTSSESPPSSSGSVITFKGLAYPKRTVTLLKDAQVVATANTGADTAFTLTINSISAGDYIFSMYGEDIYGNRSSLLSFPVHVSGVGNTEVAGIFIAPTIGTDKLEVKRGDPILIFGQSQANANVTITVHSDTELISQVQSDESGIYNYALDSDTLEAGDHVAKSKSALRSEFSSFSVATFFKVGTENVFAKKEAICAKRGDVNADCKVNLVDFSIVAYWYKRAAPPAHVDINSDKKVDLIDFSIMAFNWTG